MNNFINNKPMKVIIFDLDETLGYFYEFSIMLDAIERFYNKKLTLSQTCRVLDLYPEYFRPSIFTILKYLSKLKEQNIINKLYIYTNNQGGKKWSRFIQTYIETKINYPIFDQIIHAFKVNGVQIEQSRTTHQKTHTDFIKCSKLPEKTKICFIDDQDHPKMEHDNVYVININPYKYGLNINILINRFIRYTIQNNNFEKIVQKKIGLFKNHVKYIFENVYKYKYIEKKEKEYNVDKIVSKRLIFLLDEFIQEF
jgi:hypothetical protein